MHTLGLQEPPTLAQAAPAALHESCKRKHPKRSITQPTAMHKHSSKAFMYIAPSAVSSSLGLMECCDKPF